ncbi:MAG TPA: Uma2 family endonuclease [Spirochaetales bacterium]|nr:Uma2 family endonuclease [Spirochaetales bacterium]
MITPVAKKTKLTYNDYLKTQDDKRYELIEGELIMTPSPVTYHQWVSKNIEYELEKFVREKKTGRVFDAPYDVCLDNENVLQPDILYISGERFNIIGEKNVQGAPDLVVEILSESTAYNDLIKKKKLYAKYGVKEYWIVDPGEKSIEVYSLVGKEYVISSSFSMNDNLESPLLTGLNIELASVFSY